MDTAFERCRARVQGLGRCLRRLGFEKTIWRVDSMRTEERLALVLTGGGRILWGGYSLGKLVRRISLSRISQVLDRAYGRLTIRMREQIIVSTSFTTCRCKDVEVRSKHIQIELDFLRWISDANFGEPVIRSMNVLSCLPETMIHSTYHFPSSATLLINFPASFPPTSFSLGFLTSLLPLTSLLVSPYRRLTRATSSLR